MLTVPLTLLSTGAAALWDLKTKRIPNLITLPAIALGLILNTYYCGPAGLADALLGTGAGIMLLIIPFALGGMGAGDVKLLAAVGALNGLQMVFYSFLYAALAGGALALGLLLLRGRLYPVLFNLCLALPNLPRHIFRRGAGQPCLAVGSGLSFPYGIAILMGTAAAYYWGGF